MMKKDIKLIALYGASSCGKSSLLRNVIKHFKPEMVINNDQDYCEVIECNNFKIGIGTAGDDYNAVKGNLDFFAENQCDIWITASRTKGEPVKAIYEVESKLGLKVIWIKKSSLSEKLGVKDFSVVNDQETEFFIDYLKREFLK